MSPPPPPPQSSHSGSRVSTAHPQPSRPPQLPARPQAPLTERGHRAGAPRWPVAPPGARPPRPRPAAGGGLWSPARPLPLIKAHTPGEVAREPLAATPAEPANLERRRWGTWGDPPTRAPCPARCSHLSYQGPAAPPRLTHAGATVVQCLSKLLISPRAARRRRRLGPLGRWSFRGPGQETPAAVAAAEDTPKHNAAHSRPQARSRLPDLSQREVSGFSRKHTRARAPTGAGYTRGGAHPSLTRLAR